MNRRCTKLSSAALTFDSTNELMSRNSITTKDICCSFISLCQSNSFPSLCFNSGLLYRVYTEYTELCLWCRRGSRYKYHNETGLPPFPFRHHVAKGDSAVVWKTFLPSASAFCFLMLSKRKQSHTTAALFALSKIPHLVPSAGLLSISVCCIVSPWTLEIELHHHIILAATIHQIVFSLSAAHCPFPGHMGGLYWGSRESLERRR